MSKITSLALQRAKEEEANKRAKAIADAIEWIKNSSDTTKIYVGSDSSVEKTKGNYNMAHYCIAIVIHKDGNAGCKIFGYVEKEIDYSNSRKTPRTRLMTEVYKVCEAYLAIEEAIGDRECEIHIDINDDAKYKSNEIINEATGYVKAMCQLDVKVKPDSPAASYCADRLESILAA